MWGKVTEYNLPNDVIRWLLSTSINVNRIRFCVSSLRFGDVNISLFNFENLGQGHNKMSSHTSFYASSFQCEDINISFLTLKFRSRSRSSTLVTVPFDVHFCASPHRFRNMNSKSIDLRSRSRITTFTLVSFNGKNDSLFDGSSNACPIDHHLRNICS